MFIALLPTSFIGPSLCMFVMSLLVKIMNKTKWPQLYHICTNQAIEITREADSILFLKIGLYILLHFAKEMLSLLIFFSYNYYIIRDWWYFKSCFSMISLISSEFYFIYIFSIIFLKTPKRSIACFLVPEVQFLQKRSKQRKGNSSQPCNIVE